tara:strand:+ start:412 stop:609 length:198 start_codon:yes stop_codon:yes gene_type:complete
MRPLTITPKQSEAVRSKYLQNPDGHQSFDDMEQSLMEGGAGMDGAVVLRWCNMWLCIETCGHCHS